MLHNGLQVIILSLINEKSIIDRKTSLLIFILIDNENRE